MSLQNPEPIRVPAPGSRLAIFGPILTILVSSLFIVLPRNQNSSVSGSILILVFIIGLYSQSLAEFQSSKTLYRTNKDLFYPPSTLASVLIKIAPGFLVIAALFLFFPLNIRH